MNEDRPAKDVVTIVFRPAGVAQRTDVDLTFPAEDSSTKPGPW